ncbi:hypothetical protein [Desulfobacula toluolica]|uniref:Conserved uncharacterized protein n=1 Tax=Desulfobacula toluolica (strain DSM 7467 / Tol2) TaxID=651182 RepID=K0NPD5_DESTT|nr:hypothetical protein [Desulfobacula toluolica]CCK80697.1 conserved uncharacterized protein [Desulfobacula toluolica Tol2]
MKEKIKDFNSINCPYHDYTRKNNDQEKRISNVLCYSLLLLLLVLIFQSAAYATNEPALRLFPTNVVENLKQTGAAAKSMELNLQDVIRDLETQMELFNSSKCEGSEADEGCSELTRQLGETYLEMLDKISEQLPAMEQSVAGTRNSLKKRIQIELGRKMSPRQLQEMIHGDDAKKRNLTEKRRTSGRLRFSEKFKQYLELVSMASRPGGGGSLAVVASEIYMDTEEVVNLIALIQDEIGRARLMTELNQTFGALTPEMVGMVSGVKAILFGEEIDTKGHLPDSSNPASPENFKSPLEY